MLLNNLKKKYLTINTIYPHNNITTMGYYISNTTVSKYR